MPPTVPRIPERITSPVTWIPQEHLNPLQRLPTEKDLDAAATCQLAIANYVRLHSNALVLHEGFAISLSHHARGITAAFSPLMSPGEATEGSLAFELLKHRIRQDIACRLFPKGLPTSLEALNRDQRLFIAQEGGAVVLFYLGIIQEIAPTSTPALERRAAELIERLNRAQVVPTAAEVVWRDPSSQKLAFDEREAMLARMINYYREREERPLICIFGALHAPPEGCPAEIPDGFKEALSERADVIMQQRIISHVGQTTSLVAGGVALSAGVIAWLQRKR